VLVDLCVTIPQEESWQHTQISHEVGYRVKQLLEPNQNENRDKNYLKFEIFLSFYPRRKLMVLFGLFGTRHSRFHHLIEGLLLKVFNLWLAFEVHLVDQSNARAQNKHEKPLISCVEIRPGFYLNCHC
jgi:hypothetical protein